MAKKKEGSRRGSSAKPKRHLKEIFQKRGMRRAPSADSRTGSENTAKSIKEIKEHHKEDHNKEDHSKDYHKEDHGKEEENKARNAEGSAREKKGEDTNSDYRTVIDDIVASVDEKESITLTELSKEFSLPYARLEAWGRILDKSGIIELEYPIVGDVMLRKKGYAATHKTKKGEKKGAKEMKKADAAENKADTAETKADMQAAHGEAEKSDALKEDEIDKSESAAGKPAEEEPKEGEKTAEEKHEPDKTIVGEKAELDAKAEKKKLSKKKFRLIMVGFIIVIVALVGVLIYSLSKAGYITLG